MNSARETRPDYARPGQLVDVNGFKLHIHALGEGTPAVILEAAIGDFSLTWSLIHEAVSQFTRAVVYDRAGLGWSDVSTATRSGLVMARELKRLLDATHVPGPYILVGHSFSALLVRLFDLEYPGQVAGMVLLDPAHEDQFLRFPDPIREAFGPLRAGQLALLQQNADAIRQQGPEAGTPVVAAPASFPPEVAAIYRWRSIADPSRVETMMRELENLELTQQQVRDRRPVSLGELPLTVLSHGRPQAVPGMSDEVNQAYEDAWQEMQREIAEMSSIGQRKIAQDSGHNIHHEQPELVIQTIRDMVDTLRRQGA